MKQTMTTTDIADKLCEDTSAGWSWNGAEALAEYLEEFEDSTGVEMEFDKVGIRCEFSERAGLAEWAAENIGSDWRDELGADDAPDSEDDDEHDADTLQKIRDYIEHRTTLIEFDGGIITGQY